MSLSFGILVFPQVQQLDLTGPYEVFASARGAEVHLIWKDTAPLKAATGLTLTWESVPTPQAPFAAV